MGVPKFYRWISERYPCLSEVVKEYQIPEFDNLYLDMNGIIHVCSHPNDEDVVSRIPEEKIFADIFHYLEVLFRMVRPRKLFFMAVDGVAPRAKMNQQRGRRFKSAREAENREKEARAKGIEIPTEERFDSNCITPGTPFMARLHEQLNYFVVHKISTDPLWQSVKVILSGHQTPGEGEHKIMEYIRWSRAQPNHDPHTRHCLYGLDADLIMLGLCTHEPHFALLREEVKFGGSRKKNAAASRPSAPEHTTFHLLHLSLMREYLDYEFSSLKDKLTFPYDLESIIDDWVLMGFLVGNDFIPHLPNLHIHQGALPLLYEAYKAVLPKMDGYINEGGKLNLSRFQTFLGQLSNMDMEHFSDAQADLKWLEGRKGSNGYKPAQARAREAQMAESQKTKNKELAAYLNAKNAEIDELMLGEALESGGEDSEEYETVDDEELSSEDDEENTEDLLVQEFKAHKVNYYKEKLEYAEVTEEVLRSQAEGYVRAIQWNLYYYYEGVASWSWYYPHHYAPFISDIQNFKDLKLEFQLGKPFLPFQQLLGVLPPASKKLLPAAYAELMTSTLSPIYDYYPVNFLTDLNGKQQDWEALVLIPFIDEMRLLEAMKPCDERLSAEDKCRNQHGPMQIYMYTPEDLGAYKGRGIYGTVVHNHAALTELPREAFLLALPSQLVKGLHPKMDLSLFVPGFPTLKHIPHKHSLTEARVVVFQMPARGASMVLDILPPPAEDIHELAKQLLGKVVHVEWPHLIESRVVGISSRKLRLTQERHGEKIVESETDEAKWNLLDDEFRRRYASRWGINIGETQYLLHVTPLQGRQYAVTQAGRVTLEKQWSPVVASYPLQAVVRDINVLQPLSSLSQYNSLEEMFPPQSVCFMLGHPHYGSLARVVRSTPNQKAQIKIQCSVRSEPDLRAVHRAYKGSSYMPGYMAATRVGISSHLLSRITGNVLLVSSSGKKLGVGLNLKLNKKNQETPGYSKRIEGQWQYSRKCIEILKNYYDKFPRLFDFLSEHASKDMYNAKEIFGDKEEELLPELEAYVSQLECQHAERATCGGVGLEADVVKLLQEEVDRQKEGIKEKLLNLGVKPHLLYKPHMYSGSALPDPSTTYLILDRVIYVKEGFSVPVGLKGTVIAIIESSKPADSVYEVLFDEEFPGALSIKGSGPRAFRLSSSTLINISHGYRTISMYPPVAFAKAPPPQSVPYSVKIKEQPQNRGPSKTPTKAPPSNTGTRKSASLLMAERAKNVPSAGHQQAESVMVPPTAESLKSLLNIGQDKPSQNEGLTETSSTPLSEFEAIWLNLKKQKAQGPTLQEAAEKLPSPVPVSNAVPVSKANSTTSAAVDECSRELGKLLNISNSVPAATATLEKITPVPVNGGVTGRPLSLQELFQSTNTQPQVPLGPPLMVQPPLTSPCVELITKCQERGWGVPMYSYLETMNGVIAKIDLPIGGGIAGPPMMDRTIAAEAAASQALTHFGLRTNPLTMPLPMPIPQQLNPRFPMPPFPLTRPATSFVPLQVQAGRQPSSSKPQAGHSPNVVIPSPAAPITAAGNSHPQSTRQHNGSVYHKNSPVANEKHVKVGQNQGRPPGKPRLAARFDMAK